MSISNVNNPAIMESTSSGEGIDWGTSTPIEDDPMIKTPWDSHKDAWKQSGIMKFMPDPLGLFGGGSNEGSIRRQELEGKAAAITRSQWDHFLEVYRPVEEDILKRAMQTDFSKEGDEAGQDAAAGVRSSQGMLARNMSRLGTSMTPEQAAAVRRRANLNMGRAVGQAENTTRRTMSDTRGNLLAGLVGVGRQVATGSVAGINQAANNAASTEMMLNQGKANAQNQNMASASALAAALIMMI